MEDLKEFKNFAEDFVRRAGKIMLENFELGMKRDWKSDNTPVTEADLAINSLLIKEVKEQFSGHGVKGEEQSALTGSEEYIWVCDPIDGTLPFSHGIPIATSSLALTKNGESILGAVYDPFQDRLFSAVKGGGAYLNGKKISVSKATQLKGSVGEFEVSDISKYNIIPLIESLIGQGAKMLKFSSVIYASALLAAGELSFAVYAGVNAHDAAAVKIIVEEAGGKVTDIYGNEQKYNDKINGFIASNGLIHDKLVEMSKQLVKLRNP